MAQQPMNNNPMANIMRMISQCGNNPQAYANQILQNNPNFAKAIQGQNPQTLAMNELRKRGIDPNQIMQMIGRR